MFRLICGLLSAFYLTLKKLQYALFPNELFKKRCFEKYRLLWVVIRGIQ